MKLKTILLLVVLMMGSFSVDAANDIGFDELFSLSTDRQQALKQLIPGSEDYYYYHCVHFQNEKDFKKLGSMLKQWIDRHGYTGRVEIIRNRQAMLDYSVSKDGSLNFIKDRLNLQFNHQKQEVRVADDVPTVLDEALVTYKAFEAKARHRNSDLSGYETEWLYNINPLSLDPARRRDLLSKLTRPDYPDLVQLVVDDLSYARSRGFGSHKIHSQLTLPQLEDCLRLSSDLLNTNAFFETWIKKLHPSEFIDWENDSEEKKRYLDELWQFVQRLADAQNSLKAQVLYHMLDHERKLGNYDEKLFMQYLRLPKNRGYVNRDFIRTLQNRNYQANINQNFHSFLLLAPISDDEPLVRDYLENLLVNQSNFNDYRQFVDHDYLQHLFAKIKVLSGQGDAEKWYSMLPPEVMAELREQVEIEFMPQNPMQFDHDELIKLDVAIKNVEKLMVRIYRINTINYYREKLEEISPAIDLDGLVANEELLFDYDKPQIIRHEQTFDFPQLDQPGVYVIEFIGNGQSSRAMVRRSKLNYLHRTGAAGHGFRIINEKNDVLNDAIIWLGGREFTANEMGEIIVPYSTRPGTSKFVIIHENFASLASFDHLAENYSLEAGFFIDREQLIEGKTANLVLLPRLYLNGESIDVSLLQDTLLKIEITDREGVATSLERRHIKFNRNTDYVHEFRVPENTMSINVSLEAKVENLSQGDKTNLSDSASLAINGADTTDRIENILVRKINDEFVAEVLGKTGEPRVDIPLNLEIKHRQFVRTQNFVVKTNSEGRSKLGKLEDIEYVSIVTPQKAQLRFSPPSDKRSWQSVIHARIGEPVHVPFMGNYSQPAHSAVSLFSTVRGTYLENMTSAARLKPGFIVVDDLAAGEYEIFIKSDQQKITLRIIDGNKFARHLITDDCHFDTRPLVPLQISELSQQESQIKIHVANITPSTRVHVVASRYLQPFELFDDLGAPALPESGFSFYHRELSKYMSGRTIGDEYRYILERKHAHIYPGNLLKRPGLLLNPWSLRTTETSIAHAGEGKKWASPVASPSARRAKRSRARSKKESTSGSIAEVNLDFLPDTSVFMPNLVPDAQGFVYVDVAALKSCNHLTVYTCNLQDAVQRTISLPEQSEENADLRMRKAFATESNYSQQKNISALKSGSSFVMDDISTGEIEVYDSIASIYRLFSTLTSDPVLAEFGFITSWPDLEEERKLNLYSEYACHELNFFLYKKDEPFFNKVIKPYLANKRHKTFLDNWLLDEDLAEYLQPWGYNRLNAVEQILLAMKTKERSKGIRGHIKNLYDLLPPDLETFNRLFDTAIKASSLDTGDRFGFDDAKLEAEELVYGFADQTVAAFEMSAPGAAGRAVMSKQRALSPAAPSRLFESKSDGFALEKEADYDMGARERMKEKPTLYRALDKTEEWVENNYYKLPIERQVADLVRVNAFWKDYAVANESEPFLSESLAYAAGNFTEMMFALSVLDLDFKAADHKVEYKDSAMHLAAGANAVVFHREIKPCEAPDKVQTILVSQNMFDKGDRYRYENNERLDRFVTEEFVVFRVYGSQIAITNPTSSRKKVDVLLQVPNGAMPVENGFFTRSMHVRLEPYSTRNIEYYFYFPKPGQFRLYPVQVAENEKVIAAADGFGFNVVEEPTIIDRTSWQYVSQNGSSHEVLVFLNENNIKRLDLSLILFRLRDKRFFESVVKVLSDHFVYDDNIWSYSVLHKDTAVLRQYLPNTSLADQVETSLVSSILEIDPVKRHYYQHREYWPLVNARSFQLGRRRQILNKQFHEQYHALLADMRFRAELNDEDRMAVAYYLILQDRIGEAIGFFEQVSDSAIKSGIQYAYMKCWFAFSQGKPEIASKIARQYANYPVDRWRLLFADVINQAAEISGNAYVAADKEDRDQKQSESAHRMPALELLVEDRNIRLTYHNLEECTLNIYLMDLELLFSHNPFVQDVSGRFSTILPNESMVISLDDANHQIIALPEQFRDKNAMIEVTGGGVTRSTAYYPHSLNLRMMESFGQLQVGSSHDGTPLPKVYVKVYARMNDGSVVFYKDGYTDLRGRFDYVSLSTDELDRVERFAILIASDTHGSLVREAAPPKR